VLARTGIAPARANAGKARQVKPKHSKRALAKTNGNLNSKISSRSMDRTELFYAKKTVRKPKKYKGKSLKPLS
jgi:hypothetical protein